MEEKKTACKCKNCECCTEECKCICFKHHKGRKILAIFIIVIMFFVAVKIFCDKGDFDNRDTINVSGKGEIIVKPDIAMFSFSVMEENLDVSKGTEIVNTKIAKIINNLKANGVNEKDIKTTEYNINPRYDYINRWDNSGKQVLVGYDVTQGIKLKIRDLSKAGKIVNDLGSLGITDMGNLNFTNDKYDELVKQARDEAIKNAKEDAKILAKSLGVKLKKIVQYSDGNFDFPMNMKEERMSISASSGISKEVNLPIGENKIISNITITYEIR